MTNPLRRRTTGASRPGFFRATAVLTVGISFALLLVAVPSGHARVTKENKCRVLMGKTVRKVAAFVVKARTLCVADRLKWKAGASVDCQADPNILGGSGTGDPETDQNLAKVADFINRQVSKLQRKCTGYTAEVGVPFGTLCGSAGPNDWGQATRCAAMEIGKRAGDTFSALLDIAPRPDVPLRGCYDRIARITRASEKKLNRLRNVCFVTNDKEADSGGVRCAAINAPPGVVQTTFSGKLDSKLALVSVKLRTKLLSAYADCSADLALLNLSQADGGPLPDSTGGAFSAEDLFTDLYDALLQDVTTIDAALYPMVGYCGDGVVDNSGCGAGPGGIDVYPCEECDDGNRTSCDGCDRDCTLPACGNGAACAPDECDDGNFDSGDGCSAVCVSEYCGDGILQPIIGEQCDDGNSVDGDGCDSNCTVTACGNGVTTPPEECDNGKLNSDTDPNATCRTDCTLAGCGDGFLAPDEQCDDGGESPTCDDDCTFVLCGDGNLNLSAGELCDDGNFLNGDGCDSNCTPTSCGNGVVTLDEECDDGNLINNDGCDINCTQTRCGNGIVTLGEVCDDGNVGSGDGCDANCTPT